MYRLIKVVRRRHGGKIKNWSKTGKQSWQNDRTGTRVDYGRTHGGHYRIDVERDTLQTIGTADTKEEARRKAVDWMRRNPRG